MISRRALGGGLLGGLLGFILLGILALGVVGAQTPDLAAPATSVQAPEADQDGGDEQDGGDKQDDGGAPVGQAGITADQARQAALAQFPGATVREVELENERGRLVYEVELRDQGGREHEVTVDAGDGRVLGTEDEGRGDSEDDD